MRLSIIFVCAFMASSVEAGPYTSVKNKACPDSWALTDKVLPVVDSTSSPWGEPSNGVDDKALAKTHIGSAGPVVTIDMLPVTDDDLVNDLLTVASECLVYRNFEVDTWNYVAPPVAAPTPATGWIPAAIF